MSEEPTWGEDGYPPRHPDADKMIVPKWDEPGVCVCGAPLPPMREWQDAGRDWQHIECAACGRGFVDEEEYIHIYDDGLAKERDEV